MNKILENNVGVDTSQIIMEFVIDEKKIIEETRRKKDLCLLMIEMKQLKMKDDTIKPNKYSNCVNYNFCGKRCYDKYCNNCDYEMWSNLN